MSESGTSTPDRLQWYAFPMKGKRVYKFMTPEDANATSWTLKAQPKEVDIEERSALNILKQFKGAKSMAEVYW